MDFEITNLTNEKIPSGEIRKTFKKIAKIVKLPREAVTSVVFLNSKDMQAQNLAYRKKDEATDVLAFPFTKLPKQKDSFVVPDFARVIFGEIFLCPEKVREKSVLRSMTPEKYQKLLFVHALLHLKGMDHKKKSEADEMDRLEQNILHKIR